MGRIGFIGSIISRVRFVVGKVKIREHIATRGKFNLGQINYLLKDNFTSTSTVKTLTLILLTINPTLLTIPPTNPILPTILPIQPISPVQPIPLI